MILLWALVAQIVVISLIVFILKKMLEHMLIDLAIRHFEYGLSSDKHKPDHIDIVIHRKLNEKYVQRFDRIVKKFLPQETKIQYQIKKAIWGGVIIKDGVSMIDYSLKDRLKQAAPWLFKK